MNREITLSVENLTDEQVLKEFVKRFECDGAILLYLDRGKEFGFGRWTSTNGKNWMNEVFKIIKTMPTQQLKNKKSQKLIST